MTKSFRRWTPGWVAGDKLEEPLPNLWLNQTWDKVAIAGKKGPAAGGVRSLGFIKRFLAEGLPHGHCAWDKQTEVPPWHSLSCW